MTREKGNRLGAVLIGVVFMAVTLLIFFVAVQEKTAVHWTGLAFLLLTEALAFGSVAAIGSKTGAAQPIFAVGVATTLFVCWGLTLVDTLLFGCLMANFTAAYVTVQIVLLALAAIVCITLYLAANKTATDNAVLQEAPAFREAQALAFEMKSDPKAAPYAPLLHALYEDLQYAGKTAAQEQDAILLERMHTLQAAIQQPEGQPDVPKQVEELRHLLRQRGEAERASMRGGL